MAGKDKRTRLQKLLILSAALFKKLRALQRPALAASGREADKARKRNPAEALKTAKKRGESHLSAVSMKAQSNGLQSGTFLDMLRLFRERARLSGNVA